MEDGLDGRPDPQNAEMLLVSKVEGLHAVLPGDVADSTGAHAGI